MSVAFVTGITGQDGGYLAEALAADGWEVHGLVLAGHDDLPERLRSSPNVFTHEGDLTDAARISALIDEIQPERIVNLGGISSVSLSWANPVLTAQVTGVAAGALLEAGWRLQERSGREVRVLQASSAEIFGVPDRSPQDEQTPVRPVTPYGAAKAFAHHLVGVYRSRGLHASSCILYNHESPRRPDTFVTRKITKAAVYIAAGLQQTLSLGNLDARRDWGWAPDYVDAMLRAIAHPEPDDYIVATGTSRSVADFVEAAFREAGVDGWRSRVEVDESLVRPAEVHEQVGDATRARTVLGWKPTVDFDEMVARMVEADLAELTAR